MTDRDAPDNPDDAHPRHGARKPRKPRKPHVPYADRPPRPPIDAEALRERALHYVGRYATTTAKLRRYLANKLRERGWAGEGSATEAIEVLVTRIAELCYVDDRAFGEARARGLAAKGYGARRVAQDLQAAGLARDDVAEITAGGDGLADADRYARRRRFGPYDTHAPDPLRTRRQFAAMLRAGHGVAAIKAVLAGVETDE